jgi:hypothetical protein
VFDLDNDGKDELIRGEALGAIRAFDDDGTELWANELYTGQPLWLTAANLTPDGQPFIAASRWDGNLTIIDGTNGVATAHLPLSPIVFGSVMFGDVLGDSTRELLATSIYGYVVAMRVDGTVLWNTSLASVDGLSVAYGNFTGRSQYDVVVSHTNGSMSFLYGNNGTLFYHNNASMGTDLIIPIAVDLNYDGIDEVVVADEHVWAVDPLNQSVFYNSTVYPDGNPALPNEKIGWLWAEDVDDDSIPEFIYATEEGVYMEEFTSGRAVWSYKPDVGLITDAMLGTFINGRLGLGICTDEGALIAVDALTGNPLFFDLSSMDYNEIAVADFDGDGLDELAGSHSTNGEILAVNEVVPIVPTRPVHTNYYWTEYWNVTSTVPGVYQMDGVWTHDIDNDVIDEFVLCRSDGVIELYDPVAPTLEWQVDINMSVYDLHFSDMNEDGTMDLLILAVDSQTGWDTFVALDGTSGGSLGFGYTGGASVSLNVMAVGNFISGTSAPEYALFATISNYTQVGFFNNLGTLYAVSSVDADDFWPIKAVSGHFNNTFESDEDIAAIGLTSDGRGSTWIWHGDGVWDWNLTNAAGVTTVDIATGNLDNANEQDLISVYRYNIPFFGVYDFVMAWEPWNATGAFWGKLFNSKVHSAKPVNFDFANPDEVAVNVQGEGIIVYAGSHDKELWRYNCPSALPNSFAFDDIEGDGDMDMAVLMDTRIAIIDCSTSEPIAVYYGMYSMSSLAVGNFDDQGAPDIIVYSGRTVYCLTDGTTPPLAAMLDNLFVQAALEATIFIGIISIPLIVAFSPPARLVLAKRKRKEIG